VGQLYNGVSSGQELQVCFWEGFGEVLGCCAAPALTFIFALAPDDGTRLEIAHLKA